MRGCFIEREPEPGLPFKWKYKFAWSCLRTAEKVHAFFNLAEAEAIAKEIKGAYVLEINISPPPTRRVSTRKMT
jgi:hypothetical protein